MTLGKVDRLGQRLGPALESLRPAFRELDDANQAVLPFVEEATPIVRDEIRPFARAGRPFFRDLGTSARDLAKGAPDLTETFRGLNRLFNIGAHNPNGSEELSGDLAKDRARDEGYLYWLGWTAQNTVSLFSTSDAQGPFRRIFLGGVNCNTFTGEGVPQPVSRRARRRGGVRQVIKKTPSLGRIVAMVVFALSCFALVMFLWLTFGGPIPLQPEGYRVQVAFPEAATLAEEADVRISGVNVGKVKTKRLDKGGARTIAEIELDGEFAPIPRDTRAILRQKTLLGETYVELSHGRPVVGHARRRRAAAGPAGRADGRARRDLRRLRRADPEGVPGVGRGARQGERGPGPRGPERRLRQPRRRSRPTAPSCSACWTSRRPRCTSCSATRARCSRRSTSARARCSELIVNSNNTFEAAASRDEALAETFRIFPVFLDESKATLARLEDFSRDTRPLVNDLKAPADDLGPTVRDLGDLAPDLENLFRDLPPLIAASRRSVPEMERVLEEAEPLFEEMHPFFEELNPILSYFNFHQATLAGFISNAAPDLSGDFGGDRYQVNVGIIEPTGFQRHLKRPDSERGNAYLSPNALQRAIALGTFESFDCPGGERLRRGGRRERQPAAEGRPEAPALPRRADARCTTASSSSASRAARRRTGARPDSARATAPPWIRTQPILTTDSQDQRHDAADLRQALPEAGDEVLRALRGLRVRLGVRGVPRHGGDLLALHGDLSGGVLARRGRRGRGHARGGDLGRSRGPGGSPGRSSAGSAPVGRTRARSRSGATPCRCRARWWSRTAGSPS